MSEFDASGSSAETLAGAISNALGKVDIGAEAGHVSIETSSINVTPDGEFQVSIKVIVTEDLVDVFDEEADPTKDVQAQDPDFEGNTTLEVDQVAEGEEPEDTDNELIIDKDDVPEMVPEPAPELNDDTKLTSAAAQKEQALEKEKLEEEALEKAESAKKMALEKALEDAPNVNAG